MYAYIRSIVKLTSSSASKWQLRDRLRDLI